MNIGKNVFINGLQVATGTSNQWYNGTNRTIYYPGNIGLNTSTEPQYNVDISGTTNISGNTIIRGNLTAFNDVSFNGNLTVSKNIFMNGILVATNTSNQWSNSGSTGNIFYGGNIGLNTRGDPQYNVDISGTTNISGNAILEAI